MSPWDVLEQYQAGNFKEITREKPKAPGAWPKEVFGGHAAGSEEHKQICAAGGNRASALGKAYRFSPEKAREAALKRHARQS